MLSINCVIRLIVRLTRGTSRSSIIARPVAHIGGHCQKNEKDVLFEGWPREASACEPLPNKNWRCRYIIIRRDRIEYHAAKPTADQPPRGYVKLTSPSTIVEPAAENFRSGWVTIHVADENTSLYLSAAFEIEIARWEEGIKSVVAGSIAKCVVADSILRHRRECAAERVAQSVGWVGPSAKPRVSTNTGPTWYSFYCISAVHTSPSSRSAHGHTLTGHGTRSRSRFSRITPVATRSHFPGVGTTKVNEIGAPCPDQPPIML